MSFENSSELEILTTPTTMTTTTGEADDANTNMLNNKQQLASPIPSTDSAYGQSPAMKWAAMNMNHVNHVNMISNNVVPPSAMAGTLVNHTATMILEKSLENNEEMLDMLQMQQQDEYSDNWRFQIHPQDLFITPDMNSMYKPFVVSATLDNASPILLHHHASPDLQQQQQHFFNSISMSMNSLENNNQNAAAADQQSAAAPWQVWDQQEDSPPHSAFSLFSPTLPFVSVFDNPVSSSSTTTATGSPADKLTLNTTLNQIHQHQQQQMSGDPNTAASDSLFSFIPATPTAATNLESPTTPQESTSGVVRRHKRQRSSLMSPLTLQFSCLPLHSPIMMDSASFSEMQSSPILTSPFMDHSAFNAPSVSGGAGGAGGSAAASLMEKSNSNNTSSPSSASGKKTRRDKDGKQQKCFPCDLCSSTFSRNHDLKRHIRIHLGIRPYKCDTCPKSFTRMDALNRHKNVRGCKGVLESSVHDHDHDHDDDEY